MHMNHSQRVIAFTCLLLSGLTSGQSAAEGPVLASCEARDTLARLTDSQPDAQACLDGLTWSPGPFSVTCQVDQPSMRRVIVSFPSPVPSGDATNDRVTMEWHQPFLEDTEQSERPAVLVVHESGRAMPVGRLFARAFQAEGLHAFLIHLPYYGLRRGASDRPEPENLVTVIRQAIADVRRARDAIAVLPGVDASGSAFREPVLGGFVVAWLPVWTMPIKATS
jgi:hypothetical protein